MVHIYTKSTRMRSLADTALNIQFAMGGSVLRRAAALKAYTFIKYKLLALF
jgi:hypothetical protein